MNGFPALSLDQPRAVHRATDGTQGQVIAVRPLSWKTSRDDKVNITFVLTWNSCRSGAGRACDEEFLTRREWSSYEEGR